MCIFETNGLVMNLPDKVTISLRVRPLLVKCVIRVVRSSVNFGRSELAKLLLAMVESLLPSFTVHDGPPTCIINVNMSLFVYIMIWLYMQILINLNIQQMMRPVLLQLQCQHKTQLLGILSLHQLLLCQ